MQVYIVLCCFELSHSWLYVVCQKKKKKCGKIEIKVESFYLTEQLSATNIEVVISLEKR